MNIRKAVDYSTMFATLESVMKADLPQMELYCEIGKAVCAHSEKGAAVAAAEFIKEQYPDMTGFSPRNVWKPDGGEVSGPVCRCQKGSPTAKCSAKSRLKSGCAMT